MPSRPNRRPTPSTDPRGWGSDRRRSVDFPICVRAHRRCPPAAGPGSRQGVDGAEAPVAVGGGVPRERVRPRRSLVRRPQQPAAGSATPHPNSASESTNRTKSAMILTLGGLLGGPLVGGAVAGGSAAAGSEAGIGVGALLSLAGLGVGVWGIFEWINGHSDMGDLELDGTRAGYVSVSPIRGGAVGTVALSF